MINPARWSILLVVLLLTAVYFGLFNHDFSVNGLRYADEVERGVALFHPNHLLPSAFNRLVYLAWHGFVPGLRAIWIMQAINCLAGIVTAVCVGVIAMRRGDPVTAGLLALLYGLAFAAWNFAEEPDVYVLPALCVGVSLACLMRRSSLGWRDVNVLAVLAVLAVLTLQQYVLWYPALLALAAARELGPQRRAKLMVMAAVVPLACLAAYLLVGWQQHRLVPMDAVPGWFLGYAWDAQRGFGIYRAAPDLLARLGGACAGLVNLVFPYEMAASVPAMCAAALTGTGLLLLILRAVKRLLRSGSAVQRDAAILLAWCAANAAFATWWESRNIEFLFPVWLGVCLLLAMAAPALNWRLLSPVVVLIAVLNLVWTFWPQRDWPQRYVTVAALARAEQLGPEDALVTDELNSIGYLHYFQHVDVAFLPGIVSGAMHAARSPAQVGAAIDAAIASRTRVYSTEPGEQGRLRDIARRFPWLGGGASTGAAAAGGIDATLADFYAGYDLRAVGDGSAWRVQARQSHQ